MLDYAHNPEALRALGRTISALTPDTARSIAMISIPGDRRDEEIRAMGEIGAEYFDVLVFRETPDNRGRRQGEVMRLMTEGALAHGHDPQAIHAVHEEAEAAELTLRLAEPGDVAVLTPTRVEAAWDIIRDFRPAARANGAPAGLQLEPPHG